MFPCIFHFGSSRCYESEGFLNLFGRKPQHLLGGRSNLCVWRLRPVQWHTDHREFVGRASWRWGTPFEMLLEPAWGCVRFILVVVSRLRTSCLMDLLPHRFLNKSFRKTCSKLSAITLLHWRTGVALMSRIVTSNSLAKWSSIFQFGSSRCYESEDFSKRFGRKPQDLIGRRSH